MGKQAGGRRRMTRSGEGRKQGRKSRGAVQCFDLPDGESATASHQSQFAQSTVRSIQSRLLVPPPGAEAALGLNHSCHDGTALFMQV